MYIKRAIEKVVLDLSKNYYVILLTGPRQVGKTTLLKNIKEESRKYITLDDLLIREFANSEPSLFLQRYKPPLIIDEIQYAPNLLSYIKMYVDEHKNYGDFWLTGSQSFHLMNNVSESLAGRCAVLNMLGLSNQEINGNENLLYDNNFNSLLNKIDIYKKINLNEVYLRIFKGSFPALYEKKKDVELFYSSLVSTYLQRDIRSLINVKNEMQFMNFLISVCARTSQMLNYADISKDIGISIPTVKEWLSILISSNLVYLVQPYYNNNLNRIIKAPNLYFLDTGLCAYLTRWSSPETLENGNMSGAFFETFVVSEIIKSYYNVGKKPPIYYYRDFDKKEIDLIIEKDNILYPIEIKKSSNPKKDIVKNFSILKKTNREIGTGNIICLSQELLPIDSNNYIVPVWLI